MMPVYAVAPLARSTSLQSVPPATQRRIASAASITPMQLVVDSANSVLLSTLVASTAARLQSA